MSRKWSLFSRKKEKKADSHGTTLANEEMFFQATVRPGNKWTTATMKPTTEQTAEDSTAAEKQHHNKHSGANHIEKVPAEPQSQKPQNAKETSDSEPQVPIQKIEQIKPSHHPIPHKNTMVSDPIMLSAASVPRTSPRIARKLIKPGASNSHQAYVVPPANTTTAVSINDEYTDPYDAVAGSGNQLKAEQATTDGYVEPYEAQKMYLDVTHGSHEPSNTDPKKKLYDDPWDSSNARQGNASEYEEPWDNSETLPFQAKRPQQVPLKPRALLDKQGDVRDCIVSSHSGNSSTSSSSASIAKQRMVRVDSPRHSPRTSPRSSPKLDQRLIRPVDNGYQVNVDPRLQLYTVPGAGPMKHRPVDHRLVKAEPSLGELRRSSPLGNRTGSSKGSSRTNSPAGSGGVSPNRSPINTMVSNDPLYRLTSEQMRRASSPLVNPANVPHHMLNKAKSRSLDIRNPIFLPMARDRPHHPFPKSASDDQLAQAAVINNISAYRPGQPLGGVTEYDEPWDSGDPRQNRGSSIPPNIVHSRSRSYDLQYVPPQAYVRHEKSRSFDKQEAPPSTRASDYEQPWDQREVPLTHLESMQRFQHRQLELHPAEAISHKDFDPFVALQKQSWFHGAISRDEANRRLEKEVEGTYLVRNSESVPHNYSLSLRTRDGTIHMVISRTRDVQWILGEFSAPFHSVPEMIAYYATHRLKISDSLQISLQHPLPEEYL